MKHEKCYYCGDDTSEEGEYYVHTMYYIHKRILVFVGYKYSSEKVRIPRCKGCRSKHESFGRIWFPLFFLGFLGFGFWISYEVYGSLWVSLFGSGLASWIVTVLTFWFAERILFGKINRIPPADDIDRYPVVHEMLEAGWVKSLPEPSSIPETGEQRRKSQSKQKA